MKVYPSTSVIEYTDKTDLNTEIPLAYINTNYVENNITINIKNDYNFDKTKEVLPYDNFVSDDDGYPNITLFNNDKAEIPQDLQEKLLIRKSNTYDYMYVPNSYITFEPYTFYYSVLAKKQIDYTSIRKFNIKVACNSKELAKKLIKYFTPLYGEGLYPSNIIFNNGDNSLNSLLNSSFDNLDFLFIESEDGEHYENGNLINFNEMLSYGVIPVIICNQFKMSKQVINPIRMNFKLEKDIVMNSKEVETDGYFEVPKDDDKTLYINPFKYRPVYAPFLIKEIVNKGYIIYFNQKFISSLDFDYPIFYNALFEVYLKAYVKTKKQKEWITDVIPDYIVENGKLIQKNKFTSKIELHKLLNLYEGDVKPISIEITDKNGNIDNNVYYTGMSSNYLVFKKVYLKNISDPVKDSNQISIYTAKKNIMYYDKFIYTIQENIGKHINCNIVDDKLFINITPFKNSFLNTRNFKNTINLEYKLKDELTQALYLLWNKNLATVYYSEQYSENDILLAEIIISKDKKTTYLYDMRQRGGGLNDNDETKADCFDINNIAGKAYRRGGSLIATIKLPKRYSEKNDEIYNIIYNTLKKNMIVDDYLILNLIYE